MYKQFVETAAHLIEEKYPHCTGAILAGSVIRGEETENSDLDMVILDPSIKEAYRESFIYCGLPVEAFIHNESSIREFFRNDVERARPSLPRMVAEGVVLRVCSEITVLKKEAAELLETGPKPWNSFQIEFARYFITDLLDDFIGCTNSNELVFITGALAEKVHEFYLRTNKQWIGQSKWIYRALKNYDEEFAKEFALTFDKFYRLRDKERVVELVDRILKPYGGRLMDGFSIGKREN